MSTSQRTFDQVKSILGKLDRCIDAARERRLHAVGPAVVGSGAVVPPMIASRADENGLGHDPRAPFGRAKPMRLEERRGT
jgi:hypothetical protein